VLRLPFTIGVVTTLLFFRGWVRRERGTVIRAGSFPYSGNNNTWDFKNGLARFSEFLIVDSDSAGNDANH